jgi:hypothetical protein
MSTNAASSLMTTSAIVAETATELHVIQIKGYSLTKGLSNSNFIKSSTFSVCDRCWYIRYYPDGEGDNAGWISLYLQLDATLRTSKLDSNSVFSMTSVNRCQHSARNTLCIPSPLEVHAGVSQIRWKEGPGGIVLSERSPSQRTSKQRPPHRHSVSVSSCHRPTCTSILAASS